MSDLIIISTTSDIRSTLDAIARVLVAEKLAACVQIAGPFTSHYTWQGKPETSEEWSCLIKSRLDLWEAVESRIIELHHYETPQIVATPIVSVCAAYREWVDSQIREKSR